MTCMEVQKLITPFIKDELDIAQMEDFLHHVQTCPICREELEVYYALLTAMKQLDEEEELSNDYSADLDAKIAQNEERIRRIKARHVRKRFYLLFMVFFFVLLSSAQIGKDTFIEEKVEHSSFLLNYEGLPSYIDPIKQMMDRYDEGAHSYVKEVRARNQRMRKLFFDALRDQQYRRNGVFHKTIY